jgi:hypothetical protein
MYLDPWMIFTLCIAFGACAFLSRRGGFTAGAMTTLQALEEQRYIKIDDDGNIKRWTPYSEEIKKTKKKLDRSK